MFPVCQTRLLSPLLMSLVAFMITPALFAESGVPGERKYSGKVALTEAILDQKLSFPTSDRLALQGYWLPAKRSTADAVMMFPAPGHAVDEGWLALAVKLQEQQFSVLLFDWRGCGMNGPKRYVRVFEDEIAFKQDRFNRMYAPRHATRDGLNYQQFTTRYRDSLMQDLAAARFFLDKQNDDQQCNTNRIWMITEGQGAHLGLAFIASESFRPSLQKPNHLTAIQDQRNAVKDYAGIVALSYDDNHPTARAVLNHSFAKQGASVAAKEGKAHMANRLAMVMIHDHRESPSASRNAIATFCRGTDEQLKMNFKYVRAIDSGKASKTLKGSALFTDDDRYGTRDYIVRALVEISKDKQDFGKGRTKRNVAETTMVPRFPIETFKPN